MSYADSPSCPECRGPAILQEEHPRASELSKRLICAACGHGFDGTENEHARAYAAGMKWDRKLAREEQQRRTSAKQRELDAKLARIREGRW